MQPAAQLETGLRLNQQLVLTRELLALSAPDLVYRIETEMASNPALDWAADIPSSSFVVPTAPELTPGELVRTPLVLVDHLLAQVRLQLEPDDFPLAGDLINCLDSHGWLTEDPAILAVRLGVDETAIARVTLQLQTLDPPGIGARDA